jgi:serine/threonine protein kinase
MTNPENWERIGALFQRALELPQDERAEFLRQQCGDDESVRAEVASLVEAHAEAEGFLDSPVPRAPGDVPRLASGTRLGVFEILERLGAGGMGEVYRARDTRLDRLVAVKVLSADLAGDPRGRERFEREAHIISKLTHPHICTLHDVGSASVQGVEVPFLVMELLEGETLATRLARGPLPLAQALRCAIEIAEALAAAHALGIVHRDLKPANIMLTKAGVELLDFGLARLREPIVTDRGSIGAAGQDSLTSAGLVLGTLPYMAPEQVRGDDVDTRTDLFAFGAVLYEMLTGARAFAADSQAGLIAAILEHDPPPLSTQQPLTPPALERIVETCLAKNPGERWQHAQDLAFALREVAERGTAEHVPRPATKTGARAAVGRWLPHAAWALLTAVLALMLWSGRPVAPAPNKEPVVVLMDSPGRTYDAATRAAGATNADDISYALRDLPVVSVKENTNSMWDREEQVIRQNPDLIVSHLSCLLDARMANADEALEKLLFDVAANRLTLFLGYVGTVNPRTRFLVYSRSQFAEKGKADKWVGDVEARFPMLKGRVFTMSMPGGRASATFRDATTAQMLRAQVKELLALP